MQILKSSFAALFIACALASEAGAANVLISIDQTGANDPVNIANPRTWNFTITAAGALAGLTVDRSLFALKNGSQTTEAITFSLYSGLGGNVAGNNLLRTISLSANSFDSSYEPQHSFGFGSYTFEAGNYSATLTSPTAVGGSTNYFIKAGKLALYTDSGGATPGAALDPTLWIQDSNSTGTATNTESPPAVPEPGRAALLLVGGALALLRRRRKSVFDLA